MGAPLAVVLLKEKGLVRADVDENAWAARLGSW